MAKKRVAKKKAAASRKAKRSSSSVHGKQVSKKKTVSKKVTRKVPKSSKRKSSAKNLTPAQLDDEIVKLVQQRYLTVVEEIKERVEHHDSLFESQQENQILAQLAAEDHGPVPHSTLRSIFREIFSAARAQYKTLRVAYLGPPYSFTHLAAIERFGKSTDLIPVNTIAAVFEEVNRGHAEFGLVPIENSTDGRVVDTLDMFTRLPLRICGEVQLAVHHNLLARCPRSEITEIYSKPQALSQCRDWLARNMPQARLIEVTSTSTAAQLARDKPGAGAVASQQAAVQYDLQIVAAEIEDNKENVTRFAVIGDHESEPTGHDRTALLLQIPHKPGSLSDALTAFKKNKINLTWIESFPLRGPEVGYLFFLDFEGHCHDPKISRTIKELERKAVRMDVLGSYPRSEPLN